MRIGFWKIIVIRRCIIFNANCVSFTDKDSNKQQAN